MKKIKNNKIILLIIFFCITFFSKQSVFANNKVEISEATFMRLKEYIFENIYSYTYNNKINNITSLAFFISNDGQFSTIVYCNRAGIDSSSCITNSPYLYQAKKKCERLSKQKCNLILEKKYLANKIEKKEVNINNIDLFFKKNLDLSNNKKNHNDYEVPSTKDTEADSNFQ